MVFADAGGKEIVPSGTDSRTLAEGVAPDRHRRGKTAVPARWTLPAVSFGIPPAADIGSATIRAAFFGRQRGERGMVRSCDGLRAGAGSNPRPSGRPSGPTDGRTSERCTTTARPKAGRTQPGKAAGGPRLSGRSGAQSKPSTRQPIRRLSGSGGRSEAPGRPVSFPFGGRGPPGLPIPSRPDPPAPDTSNRTPRARSAGGERNLMGGHPRARRSASFDGRTDRRRVVGP